MDITQQYTENGKVQNVTVASGGVYVLNGMVTGTLNVEKGGYAVISGMVTGLVRNAGTIELHGTVNNLLLEGGKAVVTGMLDTLSGVGVSSFKEGAYLGGRPFSADTEIER